MKSTFYVLILVLLSTSVTYASILDSTYLEIDTAPIYDNQSATPGTGTINVGSASGLFKVNLGKNMFVGETLSTTPLINPSGTTEINWQNGNNQVLLVEAADAARTLTYIAPKYPTPLRLEIRFTTGTANVVLPSTSLFPYGVTQTLSRELGKSDIFYIYYYENKYFTDGTFNL